MAYGSSAGTLTTGISPSPSVAGAQPAVGIQKEIANENEIHTLNFDMTDSTPSAGAFAPGAWNKFAVADISWSTGGQTVRRQVSVMHGQSISGVGQNVQVTITDHSLNPAGAAAEEYNVIVTLAPGVRAAAELPTLFPAIATPVLAPAAAVTIPIDPNSGAIAFQCAYFDTGAPAAYVDGNIEVAFMVAAQVLKSYDPHVSPGWVPIPPGATSVVITNHSGAKTYRMGPVFGIDG